VLPELKTPVLPGASHGPVLGTVLPLVITITVSCPYSAAADAVLVAHLAFILWVVAGAVVTYSRPRLRWVHIVCLTWAILVEVFPWPCPLTLLENWLEARAGVQPYQGGFLLHYLDALVYPDISPTLLMIAGVAVCAVNFGIHGIALFRERRQQS